MSETKAQGIEGDNRESFIETRLKGVDFSELTLPKEIIDALPLGKNIWFFDGVAKMDRSKAVTSLQRSTVEQFDLQLFHRLNNQGFLSKQEVKNGSWRRREIVHVMCERTLKPYNFDVKTGKRILSLEEEAPWTVESTTREALSGLVN